LLRALNELKKTINVNPYSLKTLCLFYFSNTNTYGIRNRLPIELDEQLESICIKRMTSLLTEKSNKEFDAYATKQTP